MYFHTFWSRNPALFLGLCALLATAIAFKHDLLLAALFALLLCTARSRGMFFLALACSIFTFASATLRYPKIVLPAEKIAGKGCFHIAQVKIHSSPFTRSLLYSGTLNQFKTADGSTLNHLPCTIHLPLSAKRMPANTDYEISGHLSQKADYVFVLKPDKKSTWEQVASPINLSEWRFQAKQRLSTYLKKEIADPHARTFLNALATGDVDERILSMEFGKVGLQHILAISGFHFALTAFFLNFILRLVLPSTPSGICLIALITFYYLFLGDAPSIQRAYIAIVLVAVGQLFSLRISGLNALGAALLLELSVNPLVVTQLSFQLTFLCTLAILLFYPACHHMMSWVLPKRNRLVVQSFSLLDKHGFIASALLRRTLSVNLAVHLICLPVLLHLFHKFPLLSIAYNLFFPPCVCLCMLLLFLALLLAPCLPFASHALHWLNNAWTSTLLHMTSTPPAFLDFSLRSKEISFPLVVCFLAFSFLLGVRFYEVEKKER